jgi:tRNA A37 methylthiotransferase MiaB
MRVSIHNLHNMCENNTLFLSGVWRYFLLNGHTVTDRAGTADLILIGGCAVTDRMRRRCERTVLETMQRLSNAQFVVFGCLAAFPEGLKSAVGGRDADRLHMIPYKASQRLDELIRARIPFDTVSVNELKGHVPYQPRIRPDDSYVLIAQGCVNECSYCNIKRVKGNVLSRSEETIEGEVRGLYRAGIRTMTLLADDCGSYGLDRRSDLPHLLARLSRVAQDLRYRLYTVFPSLFLQYGAELEPFFAERRVPYVCLPVQSASRRILDLMNRRYDPDHLALAIGRLRGLDPEILVYSHFIFNFPTETWDEFEQSLSFARHFDHSLFIGYGENSGTRAADLFPKCDDEALIAKMQRIGEVVERRELAASVVPTP